MIDADNFNALVRAGLYVAEEPMLNKRRPRFVVFNAAGKVFGKGQDEENALDAAYRNWQERHAEFDSKKVAPGLPPS